MSTSCFTQQSTCYFASSECGPARVTTNNISPCDPIRQFDTLLLPRNSFACRFQSVQAHALDLNPVLTCITHLYLTTVLSHWDFSQRKFGLLSPAGSQLRQSRAAQPTMHAGCFSVSLIHRTPTWSTGYLTCVQMLMRAIAHRGVRALAESWHWKNDSLPHRGINPAA